MRSGGGRAKGNGFERDVAALILQHAGKKFTKADCYRTPLSGGHRFAREKDPGDLMMSPALDKRFPFTVECKRYKEIRYEHFISSKPMSSWQEFAWLQQAIDATAKKHSTLLVMQSNRGEIFCVIPFNIWVNDDHEEMDSAASYAEFMYKDSGWVLVHFEKFLRLYFER